MMAQNEQTTEERSTVEQQSLSGSEQSPAAKRIFVQFTALNLQNCFKVKGREVFIEPRLLHDVNGIRAGFKCVEALGRIIIRGPYPPLNAIIYMYLQL